jgi:transcriptional regulator with XRE-family HTH domain
MSTLNYYGRAVREARHRAGLSLGAVSRALGFTTPYLSDIERGQRLPLDAARTIRLAAVLGCAPEPLLMAAVADRGVIEFNSPEARPLQREVGAALAVAWESLSDDQLRLILAAIGGGR